MKLASTTAVLVTILAGPAAMAGSPPRWHSDQATAAQPNDNSTANHSRDARDEGRHENGGDWKRRGDPQRADQGANSGSGRPEHGQTRPPVAPAPAPSAGNNNDRGNWTNDGRGDRRYARDPRPETDWTREQRDQSRRDWDNNRHDDHDNRNWNRDRDWDRYHWRDDRGRMWHWDRGWYDRYRFDHFRFYQGRYFARERFRFGYYRAPYGFSTRIWLRGDFLPFGYFNDGYVVRDYWSFNLFDPPFGCRWVRVRDDALLVDIATGEVVDAVYDLFW
jgi:Ni/Co efflux regulator RcnB